MTSIETAVSKTESTAPPDDTHWRYFWLLLLVAAVPMLIPYFVQMWNVSWYRYFPFAIIAVVVLTHARSDGKLYPPRSWFHWITIGLSVLLLIASAVLQFTWFAALALFLIGSCCLSAMRGPRDTSLIIVAVPLAMLVRLPLRTDHFLVIELQKVTTWLSSVMLDIAGAPHAVAGNVILLAKKELFVAEACSGIQSVFTLAFLACLLVAVRRRRIWLVPLYLVIAVFLAVAANVIRVSLVAMGDVFYELDLTTGWPHEIVGYFALGVAVLFLWSFDELVVTVLHSVTDMPSSNPLVKVWNPLCLRDEDGIEVEYGDAMGASARSEQRDQASTLARLATKMSSQKTVHYAFIAATALIAVSSVVQVLRSAKPATYAIDADSVVFQPAANLVDSALKYLKIVGHEATRGFANPNLGANADIWSCSAKNLTAEIVLSQPHKGWHELCVCYERQNWLLVDRDLTTLETGSSTDPEALQVPYVVARFKHGKQYGYLFFAGIGSDGSLIPAPSSLSAFTHRVWSRIDTAGVWEQNEVLMLQLWVVSSRKLEPETIRDLEDDFVEIRAKIASTVSDQRSTASGAAIATSDPTNSPSSVAYQRSARKDD